MFPQVTGRGVKEELRLWVWLQLCLRLRPHDCEASEPVTRVLPIIIYLLPWWMIKNFLNGLRASCFPFITTHPHLIQLLVCSFTVCICGYFGGFYFDGVSEKQWERTTCSKGLWVRLDPRQLWLLWGLNLDSTCSIRWSRWRPLLVAAGFCFQIKTQSCGRSVI